MRRFGLVLACAALPAVARAAEEKDKPMLVLDAGGHPGVVWKVLFSPDGKELITVSEDKTVRVWDVATGEAVRVLRPPAGKGPEGMLFAAALSPDGQTLAVGGFGPPDNPGAIYLIALATGRIECVLRGHTNGIDALAFAPDGKRLASGSSDGTARVWDAATGACQRTLTGHTQAVYGVTFAPDGRRLATSSHDGMGRIWSVSTGRAEAVLKGHAKEVRCIAWSRDGKTLATGSLDQSIRLWGADGAPRKRFDGLAGEVFAVAFSPDARHLLFTRGAGRSGGICSVLDLSGGRERVRFTRHTNSVMDGGLSPDSALAATTGGNDHETYLWKTADGAVLHRLASQGRSAFGAAWGNDGQTVAWGNTNRGDSVKATTPLERSFRLADLEWAGAPGPSARRARHALGALALEPAGPAAVAVRRGGGATLRLQPGDESDTVRCFTLLPGDRAAVGAAFDLSLFDTRTGQKVRDFRGHTGPVWAVAPSPDNRYLLSASLDQTLRIWDPEREEPLVSLFFAGDDWVAWTPEGYYAASPGGERLIGWQVGNGPDRMASFHPAEKFRKSLYRPDVIKLLLKAGSVEKALALADRERGRKTERTEVAQVLPPKVVLTAPAAGKLTRAEVEVTATATSAGGHPVTALRLLVDGRPFQGEAGVQRVARPQLGEARASWSVTLTPGRHRLAALADSAVSQGKSDEVVVAYAGAEKEEAVKPTLYVLAIGVADYRARGLRLHYAAQDAQALAGAFQKHSQPLFHDIRVRLLTDGKATRAGVLQGMKWLRQEVTQRDYAVVFFSGHGHRDADGTLYFLPADVDPDDVASTSVTAEQIMNPLKALPGKILVLLDTCHAGGVGGGKRKSLTDDLVRDLVREESGLAVLCSSTAREESLENNEHRLSNFTLAVVEGLSGKAGKALNGAVYLHHLDAYVTDRVKQLSRGQQHPVTRRPETVASFPLSRP
jgi:WD40 repeat protein